MASAALDVLVEERLVERSAELGAYMADRLRAHAARRSIKEVRGIGLWAGIELRARGRRRARATARRSRTRGLLCKETHTHTIRLAPPLVITRDELDWALERLEEVLATLRGGQDDDPFRSTS